MAYPFSLPQDYKIVQAIAPVALGAAKTGDYICMKNAHKVWVLVEVSRGADATDITLSLYKATADGVGNTAFTTVVPIWKNADTGASDTLVAQTAAVSHATGTTQSKNMQIWFEVDPGSQGETYDWMYVYSSAGNAAHVISATYFIAERYKQSTPPTAIA